MKLTRREFGKLSALAGAAIVLPADLSLTGCSSTAIQDALTVAAQVATSAGALISPISAEYGLLVTGVGTILKDISSDYSAYEAAAAADRPGILGKIHALATVLAGNLTQILADARIKAASLVTEIGVAVAVLNSALSLVLAHLPAVTPAAQAASQQAAALPIIKGAKSASDLANAWNQAVGPNHPGAVVTAPKHKKLGIF